MLEENRKKLKKLAEEINTKHMGNFGFLRVEFDGTCCIDEEAATPANLMKLSEDLIVLRGLYVDWY